MASVHPLDYDSGSIGDILFEISWRQKKDGVLSVIPFAQSWLFRSRKQQLVHAYNLAVGPLMDFRRLSRS